MFLFLPKKTQLYLFPNKTNPRLLLVVISVLIGRRCVCKCSDSLIDDFYWTVCTRYHCSLNVSVLNYTSVYSACTYMHADKSYVSVWPGMCQIQSDKQCQSNSYGCKPLCTLKYNSTNIAALKLWEIQTMVCVLCVMSFVCMWRSCQQDCGFLESLI